MDEESAKIFRSVSYASGPFRSLCLRLASCPEQQYMLREAATRLLQTSYCEAM